MTIHQQEINNYALCLDSQSCVEELSAGTGIAV
jgi:hypothetical protein